MLFQSLSSLSVNETVSSLAICRSCWNKNIVKYFINISWLREGVEKQEKSGQEIGKKVEGLATGREGAETRNEEGKEKGVGTTNKEGGEQGRGRWGPGRGR